MHAKRTAYQPAALHGEVVHARADQRQTRSALAAAAAAAAAGERQLHKARGAKVGLAIHLKQRLEGVAAQTAAAELPAMDTNGFADAYAVIHLISPSGVAYPPSGVVSRVAYRTTRPLWRQFFEIGLRGGTIEADGLYRNAAGTSGTSLLIQVFDADCGVWGWAYILVRLLGLALAGALGAAYVTGISDGFSAAQVHAIGAAAASLGAAAAALFVAARVFKADDDLVGECAIPLDALMDQKEHVILATLHAPPLPLPAAATGKTESPPVKTESPPVKTESPQVAEAPATASASAGGGEGGVARRAAAPPPGGWKLNAAGGHGILRLKLSCSER